MWIFFLDHRCFIWNSCDFAYVGCGNLYLGEQGKESAFTIQVNEIKI